ncbi:unnamed protein product [Brachionus calyciflorus]|uniref:Uncharacterized protein n=1 Tax=Brachionus calyciflorus TaxID=104777 RepID=A0A813TBW0_9BILA|nr:unnamed protein product [Brachionus calyciflorus]
MTSKSLKINRNNFFIIFLLISFEKILANNDNKNCRLVNENNAFHVSCYSLKIAPNYTDIKMNYLNTSNIVYYKPLDTNKIINNISLIGSINYFNQLSYPEYPQIFYVNTNGFDIDLFRYLNRSTFSELDIYLFSTKFDLYFPNGTLVKKCIDWLHAINKDININLDDQTYVSGLSNRKFIITITHMSNFIDYTYTINHLFPDEDFYNIKREYPYDFTCTFNFIRQQNRRLFQKYPIALSDSILDLKSNISHCNFELMNSLCDTKKHLKDSFDIVTFVETSIFVDYLLMLEQKSI